MKHVYIEQVEMKNWLVNTHQLNDQLLNQSTVPDTPNCL